jgi:phosphatidylglycerol:prolipoprotein diacylglycerol transferase
MWFDRVPFSQTFHLGPLVVQPYGLAYLLSFLLVYAWFVRRPVRTRLRLEPRDVQRLMFYFLVAVLLGGRIGFVAADAWRDPSPAQYYLAHPATALAFWLPGRTSFGGIAAVLLVLALFSRRRGTRYFERLGDELVVMLPLCFALVRIATFLTGSIPGRVCAPVQPWCVPFAGFEGLRYPATLIEAGLDLITFGILLFVRSRAARAGVTGWSWIVLYAAARFVAEAWREPGAVLLGLTDGQVAALVMAAIGICGLASCLRSGPSDRAVLPAG